MGCCISKCRPDKHSLEQHQLNHVLQDKLVISQAPVPTPIPHHSSKKISPSPPSPTSSTSSISSFTCTTSNTISSSTSSLSSASSALSSKDRSFSNEFLWSCYKDNPHIIRMNSLREATTLSLMPTKPNKAQSRNINVNPSSAKPSLAPMKQSPPQKIVGSFSMPQKRVRPNSPTNLTRQKSFRKEPINPVSNIPSRTLGSPSPSRRFINGDKCASALANTIMDNSFSKRMINGSNSKVSAAHYSHCVSSSVRKESVKAASPNNSSLRLHSGLRHGKTCTYKVGSKIDETVVKDVLSNHDMDSDLVEDIDNPLISLDCFIFL